MACVERPEEGIPRGSERQKLSPFCSIKHETSRTTPPPSHCHRLCQCYSVPAECNDVAALRACYDELAQETDPYPHAGVLAKREEIPGLVFDEMTRLLIAYRHHSHYSPNGNGNMTHEGEGKRRRKEHHKHEVKDRDEGEEYHSPSSCVSSFFHQPPARMQEQFFRWRCQLFLPSSASVSQASDSSLMYRQHYALLDMSSVSLPATWVRGIMIFYKKKLKAIWGWLEAGKGGDEGGGRRKRRKRQPRVVPAPPPLVVGSAGGGSILRPMDDKERGENTSITPASNPIERSDDSLEHPSCFISPSSHFCSSFKLPPRTSSLLPTATGPAVPPPPPPLPLPMFWEAFPAPPLLSSGEQLSRGFPMRESPRGDEECRGQSQKKKHGDGEKKGQGREGKNEEAERVPLLPSFFFNSTILLRQVVYAHLCRSWSLSVGRCQYCASSTRATRAAEAGMDGRLVGVIDGGKSLGKEEQGLEGEVEKTRESEIPLVLLPPSSPSSSSLSGTSAKEGDVERSSLSLYTVKRKAVSPPPPPPPPYSSSLSGGDRSVPHVVAKQQDTKERLLHHPLFIEALDLLPQLVSSFRLARGLCKAILLPPSPSPICHQNIFPFCAPLPPPGDLAGGGKSAGGKGPPYGSLPLRTTPTSSVALSSFPLLFSSASSTLPPSHASPCYPGTYRQGLSSPFPRPPHFSPSHTSAPRWTAPRSFTTSPPWSGDEERGGEEGEGEEEPLFFLLPNEDEFHTEILRSEFGNPEWLRYVLTMLLGALQLQYPLHMENIRSGHHPRLYPVNAEVQEEATKEIDREKEAEHETGIGRRFSSSFSSSSSSSSSSSTLSPSPVDAVTVTADTPPSRMRTSPPSFSSSAARPSTSFFSNSNSSSSIKSVEPASVPFPSPHQLPSHASDLHYYNGGGGRNARYYLDGKENDHNNNKNNNEEEEGCTHHPHRMIRHPSSTRSTTLNNLPPTSTRKWVAAGQQLLRWSVGGETATQFLQLLSLLFMQAQCQFIFPHLYYRELVIHLLQCKNTNEQNDDNEEDDDNSKHNDDGNDVHDESKEKKKKEVVMMEEEKPQKYKSEAEEEHKRRQNQNDACHSSSHYHETEVKPNRMPSSSSCYFSSFSFSSSTTAVTPSTLTACWVENASRLCHSDPFRQVVALLTNQISSYLRSLFPFAAATAAHRYYRAVVLLQLFGISYENDAHLYHLGDLAASWMKKWNRRSTSATKKKKMNKNPERKRETQNGRVWGRRKKKDSTGSTPVVKHNPPVHPLSTGTSSSSAGRNFGHHERREQDGGVPQKSSPLTTTAITTTTAISTDLVGIEKEGETNTGEEKEEEEEEASASTAEISHPSLSSSSSRLSFSCSSSLPPPAPNGLRFTFEQAAAVTPSVYHCHCIHITSPRSSPPALSSSFSCSGDGKGAGREEEGAKSRGGKKEKGFSVSSSSSSSADSAAAAASLVAFSLDASIPHIQADISIEHSFLYFAYRSVLRPLLWAFLKVRKRVVEYPSSVPALLKVAWKEEIGGGGGGGGGKRKMRKGIFFPSSSFSSCCSSAVPAAEVNGRNTNEESKRKEKEGKNGNDSSLGVCGEDVYDPDEEEEEEHQYYYSLFHQLSRTAVEEIVIPATSRLLRWQALQLGPHPPMAHNPLGALAFPLAMGKALEEIIHTLKNVALHGGIPSLPPRGDDDENIFPKKNPTGNEQEKKEADGREDKEEEIVTRSTMQSSSTPQSLPSVEHQLWWLTYHVMQIDILLHSLFEVREETVMVETTSRGRDTNNSDPLAHEKVDEGREKVRSRSSRLSRGTPITSSTGTTEKKMASSSSSCVPSPPPSMPEECVLHQGIAHLYRSFASILTSIHPNAPVLLAVLLLNSLHTFLMNQESHPPPPPPSSSFSASLSSSSRFMKHPRQRKKSPDGKKMWRSNGEEKEDEEEKIVLGMEGRGRKTKKKMESVASVMAGDDVPLPSCSFSPSSSSFPLPSVDSPTVVQKTNKIGLRVEAPSHTSSSSSSSSFSIISSTPPSPASPPTQAKKKKGMTQKKILLLPLSTTQEVDALLRLSRCADSHIWEESYKELLLARLLYPLNPARIPLSFPPSPFFSPSPSRCLAHRSPIMQAMALSARRKYYWEGRMLSYLSQLAVDANMRAGATHGNTSTNHLSPSVPSFTSSSPSFAFASSLSSSASMPRRLREPVPSPPFPPSSSSPPRHEEEGDPPPLFSDGSAWKKKKKGERKWGRGCTITQTPPAGDAAGGVDVPSWQLPSSLLNDVLNGFHPLFLSFQYLSSSPSPPPSLPLCRSSSTRNPAAGGTSRVGPMGMRTTSMAAHHSHTSTTTTSSSSTLSLLFSTVHVLLNILDWRHFPPTKCSFSSSFGGGGGGVNELWLRRGIQRRSDLGEPSTSPSSSTRSGELQHPLQKGETPPPLRSASTMVLPMPPEFLAATTDVMSHFFQHHSHPFGSVGKKKGLHYQSASALSTFQLRLRFSSGSKKKQKVEEEEDALFIVTLHTTLLIHRILLALTEYVQEAQEEQKQEEDEEEEVDEDEDEEEEEDDYCSSGGVSLEELVGRVHLTLQENPILFHPPSSSTTSSTDPSSSSLEQERRDVGYGSSHSWNRNHDHPLLKNMSKGNVPPSPSSCGSCPRRLLPSAFSAIPMTDVTRLLHLLRPLLVHDHLLRVYSPPPSTTGSTSGSDGASPPSSFLQHYISFDYAALQERYKRGERRLVLSHWPPPRPYASITTMSLMGLGGSAGITPLPMNPPPHPSASTCTSSSSSCFFGSTSTMKERVEEESNGGRRGKALLPPPRAASSSSAVPSVLQVEKKDPLQTSGPSSSFASSLGSGDGGGEEGRGESGGGGQERRRDRNSPTTTVPQPPPSVSTSTSSLLLDTINTATSVSPSIISMAPNPPPRSSGDNSSSIETTTSPMGQVRLPPPPPPPPSCCPVFLTPFPSSLPRPPSLSPPSAVHLLRMEKLKIWILHHLKRVHRVSHDALWRMVREGGRVPLPSPPPRTSSPSLPPPSARRREITGKDEESGVSSPGIRTSTSTTASSSSPEWMTIPPLSFPVSIGMFKVVVMELIEKQLVRRIEYYPPPPSSLDNNDLDGKGREETAQDVDEENEKRESEKEKELRVREIVMEESRPPVLRIEGGVYYEYVM